MDKSKKDIPEFNPVKETINGKKVEQAIWTTNVINKALEALQQGKPLKMTPFLNNNTKLLKPELVYKRTKEEIEDYIKCKTDPIHFASKCFIMTPQGLSACHLRDYQIDYIKHLQKHRFSLLLAARQIGKSVTTAIYCLWKILFNTDKKGLILSKSGPAGVDLLSKIKDMYLYLPYHLKIGTMKWNQTEISFDNNSSISTEAFSSTAGLGKTINFLILDEFAWCPANEIDQFYNNIIPTITTITNSNVCIMSTQNGFNKFYELWKAAIEGRSEYAPFKVDWYQVPQWNDKTKKWEKRDQKWKDMMVGILGSEEAFQYQYGTQFSASDKCLVSREVLSVLRDKAVLWENRIEDMENAGIHLNIPHREFLFWRNDFDFNELKTGHFLLIADLAEGIGSDYTPFNILQILPKDIFKHIGRWYSNSVDLENAALEFWLLAGQLFNNERCIWSLEWNTYGALFYNILMNLNESDYSKETYWRFNIVNELELYNFCTYKKIAMDEQLIGKQKHTSNFIPGLKFTNSNKPTCCTLLKLLFEKQQIDTNDMLTINELENFEDKNGNGSYKASYGHDDLVMTLVQLPMIMQTPKYKNITEELEVVNIQSNIDNKWDNTFYNDFIDNTNQYYENNMTFDIFSH